jgi:hypothetical protein
LTKSYDRSQTFILSVIEIISNCITKDQFLK